MSTLLLIVKKTSRFVRQMFLQRTLAPLSSLPWTWDKVYKQAFLGGPRYQTGKVEQLNDKDERDVVMRRNVNTDKNVRKMVQEREAYDTAGQRRGSKRCDDDTPKGRFKLIGSLLSGITYRSEHFNSSYLQPGLPLILTRSRHSEAQVHALPMTTPVQHLSVAPRFPCRMFRRGPIHSCHTRTFLSLLHKHTLVDNSCHYCCMSIILSHIACYHNKLRSPYYCHHQQQQTYNPCRILSC